MITAFTWSQAKLGAPSKNPLGGEYAEQLGRFDQFETALYDFNRTRNLTRVLQEECWLRHFIDSLLLAEFLPKNGFVLDIGSGPGFPAWPIANAFPECEVTALDSNQKMLTFLESQPLPNLFIVLARSEEYQFLEGFDLVTGRALAKLPIQLEVSAAHVKLGGYFIPMRTANDDFEATREWAFELGLELESVETRQLPTTDIIRSFPKYRKTHPTPPDYPRRWSDIIG